MRRPTPVTVLLFVAGLALIAGPLVAPAEAPPDRIEYRVDGLGGPVDSWETLQYESLSGPPRTAFDAAVAGGSDTHNVTVPDDGTLPPLASESRPVVAYDLRYGGQWYVLEVSHFDPEVPNRAQYLRIGSLLLGLLLGVVAAYRIVTD